MLQQLTFVVDDCYTAFADKRVCSATGGNGKNRPQAVDEICGLGSGRPKQALGLRFREHGQNDQKEQEKKHEGCKRPYLVPTPPVSVPTIGTGISRAANVTSAILTCF